jgi:lysozyme
MGQLQENKGKIAAATITAALLIACPFIGTHEGDKLSAYEDVVGVWTICGGVTGTHAGVKMTEQQCTDLTNSTIGHFMTKVASLIKVNVSPKLLAAHTSFSYNIGIEGYKRSKTLSLTNSGRLADGCRAMRHWVIAGGKDCTIKANGCYGLVNRRKDEINLCLSGVTP